ncbi:hypothetical protein [Priestia aryabhattai]|uniref:hypothetical protein n=1 Tax=Priestia aryabhattai TaxID=412384 RepID=UPI0015F617FD|nr:hypothetical protein [Priestia aryabhattai]
MIKNLKDLEREVNKRINKAMKENVQKEAKKTMQEKIVDEVYLAYEPSQYERSYELLNSVETKQVNKTTISIENTRHDGNRDVAKIIEEGQPYDWEKSRIAQMKLKRPFHEETRKSLENGRFKDSLKEGLKSQGLDVK